MTLQSPLSHQSWVTPTFDASRSASSSPFVVSNALQCLQLKTKPVEVIKRIIPVALAALGDYAEPVYRAVPLSDAVLVLRTGSERDKI